VIVLPIKYIEDWAYTTEPAATSNALINALELSIAYY